MAKVLGIDVGTTTITAVVLDVEDGHVIARSTSPNDAEITSDADRRRGRSEWDGARVLDRVRDAMRSAAHEADGAVDAIGLTGQMHGGLLVDMARSPVGSFVGWQDQRGVEVIDGTTAVDRLHAVSGSDVCHAKTGYLGATLAWMSASGVLPSVPFIASFLPDYVVAEMTDGPILTERTNAAGSGLYDIVEDDWSSDVVAAAGIDAACLPELRQPMSVAGPFSETWARETGMPSGVPVAVSCGDNQASFAGSVASPACMALVNVGTGGQVSVHVENALRGTGLEARPYLDGRYLLVGAGLVGGRTFAWLRDFIVEVGKDVFEAEIAGDEIYDTLTRLAADVESGSEGLMFEPLLTGTREEPLSRGVMTGIGVHNFSPGHLSRALLEGVATQFRLLYDAGIAAGASTRNQLVGAGNGIRRNPVMRGALEEAFSATMRVPVHTEEAAFGAALVGAVASGARSDLSDVARVIRYA